MGLQRVGHNLATEQQQFVHLLIHPRNVYLITSMFQALLRVLGCNRKKNCSLKFAISMEEFAKSKQIDKIIVYQIVSSAKETKKISKIRHRKVEILEQFRDVTRRPTFFVIQNLCNTFANFTITDISPWELCWGFCQFLEGHCESEAS